MAMVMVCSLMPSALAAGEGDHPLPSEGVTWTDETEPAEGEEKCSHSNRRFTGSDATCTAVGKNEWTCQDCNAKATAADSPALGHDFEKKTGTVYVDQGPKHKIQCSRCEVLSETAEDHSYTLENNTKCVCGAIDPYKLTGITLNKTKLSLKVGEDETLSATRTPTTALAPAITWTSSAPTVASVNSTTGKVEAKAAGTATITATAGDITATCAVTVTETTTIEITASAGTSSSDRLEPGDTADLEITAPTGKEIKSVKWEASSSSVEISGEKIATGKTKATATATVTGSATREKVTITATATFEDKTTATDTCDIYLDNPFYIECSPKTGKLTAMDDELTLKAILNNKAVDATWKRVSGSGIYFDWTTKNGTCVVTPLAASKDTVKATFQAKATVDGVDYEAEYEVSLQISTDLSVSATVSSDYYLSEVGDKEKDSVEDQILDYVSKLYSGSNKRYLDSIRFSNVTTEYGDLDVTKNKDIKADDLGDIRFTPKKNGKAVFSFTIDTYNSNNKGYETYSGTLTITVTDAASSGDVIFYGDVGEDVAFDAASFEDFWDDAFSGGTLSYVNFSPSGGTLRDGDGKTVNSSKDCYASPRGSQIGLDELYFEPSSANSKKATTISFSFTASGYKKSSNTLTEKKGTVSIVYMSASPKDINYSVNTSGTVNLKASDFTAAYKEATGSSAPSNLTIVFQNVPKNGSLSYTDSSKKNPSAVSLKANTIKSRSFTTKSSGTNQIGDVTYTGKSGTDTIDYIAYSGTTPKFKGSVVFNGTAAVPQDILVTFQSYNGQPVTFSLDAFLAKSTVLANAAKYRFAFPTNGSLYLNGTSNAAGIDLVPALLGSVTYRPKAGYNGPDRITFIAYDANSKMVGSGTVAITVSGNTTTTTPGGVTSASQFTDVPKDGSANWYMTELSDLVSKGIISGKGDGKFDPTGTVTYGEALKMVLEAAGHSAALGSGNDWAIHYKELAVQNNWIGRDISLNAPISREATAELIARVLGVSYSTSTSPFADTSNGYVVALYYTSPQILIGSTSTGRRLFNTNDPLLRQEVCVIIYRMNAYHLARTSNVMPDGI